VPVRIYALAKDLNIDSKELVDICTKAGIPGKGSALASLEDDEVVRVKAFLEGGATKKASSPQSAATATAAPPRRGIDAPIRSDATIPVAGNRKPAVMTSARAKASGPEVIDESPEPAPPAPTTSSPETHSERPAVETAPPAKAPRTEVEHDQEAPPSPVAKATPAKEVAPEPSTPAAESAADVGTVEPRSPADAPERGNRPERFSDRRVGGGPIKVISGGGKGPADGGDKKPQRPSARDRRPVIRLSEMPEVKQPSSPAPTQPKAQQPVIRLTPDALKPGSKAPTNIADLTKQLERQHGRINAKGPGAPGAGTTAADAGKAGPLKVDPNKRGKKGSEDEDKLAEMAGARPDRQKARTKRVNLTDEDDGVGTRRRTLTHLRRQGKTIAAPRKDKLEIELPCTVRTFSESAGVPSAKVIQQLMAMGVRATINAGIPDEMAELIAAELGLDVVFKQPESLEEKLLKQFADDTDPPEALESRPPIVTVLGHVDHGKTSLLDKIIGIDVVSGEAGGITQHIRAYQVTTKSGRKVAFVDTPGHEAFTEMRARGANVTDIAVVVIAANDGIMPQTEEAISHAKAAEVPIVVAMNKVDLPGVDQQRVLQQLATAGLLPSEWGGETEVIRTSALTGQGVDELLETLLVTADLHEYKANPNRDAMGTCLEAEQQPGRGVVAKLMVQSGTLKEGDLIVCGAAHGRVKAMFDTLKPKTKVKSAGPSTPVSVTGLDVAPGAGDKFYVVKDIVQARDLASQRASNTRERALSGITKRISLEEFQRRLAEGVVGRDDEKATLNLIVRADVRGSIEAIQKELSKFEHPEVAIRILQASVGGITVADVTLASASDAVIVGFNVIPDEPARELAEARQVEIRRYDIIYKLTDDIKAMLEGKLKPEERVVELGRALVKQVFTISRVGAVAGCQVLQGTVERGCRIRVNREGRTIGDYAIDSLKREKDDAKEVQRGMECGIKLANFNDIKQGDLLEAYRVEEFARTL
jgi:translation initiation factor IF-2